jgi:hypothetical protein
VLQIEGCGGQKQGPNESQIFQPEYSRAKGLPGNLLGYSRLFHSFMYHVVSKPSEFVNT